MKGYQVIFRVSQYYAVPVGAESEDEAIDAAFEKMEVRGEQYLQEAENDIEVQQIACLETHPYRAKPYREDDDHEE